MFRLQFEFEFFKWCNFQIPLFWNWGISTVWVLCLNEVFLVLFHLNAIGFPENISILRFWLSKVIGTCPPKFRFFQFLANVQASVRVWVLQMIDCTHICTFCPDSMLVFRFDDCQYANKWDFSWKKKIIWTCWSQLNFSDPLYSRSHTGFCMQCRV